MHFLRECRRACGRGKICFMPCGVGMKIKLGFKCVLTFFSVLAFSQAALAACESNSIVLDETDDVFVSDFVVSIQESKCPVEGIDVSMPILQRNSKIQFWFRLQGSDDYLRSAMARQPFDVRFSRLQENVPLYEDAIGVSSVRRSGPAPRHRQMRAGSTGGSGFARSVSSNPETTCSRLSRTGS